MAGADFDKYVDDYREIINRVSSISGEQFEFFIRLRLGLVRERVSGPTRILDFGCGIGATETYLREVFPDAAICGVDSSAESIRAAREKGPADVQFVHSEGGELPFPDGAFDLIYSNGTFHHLEPVHRGPFIRELHRVCRQDGSLFVFENNPRNPLMMRAMKRNPFDAGVTVVHPRKLREMAAAAGFACKETGYYFFFPKFLRRLRWTEKWLRPVPFGAQYFLWATKTRG